MENLFRMADTTIAAYQSRYPIFGKNIFVASGARLIGDLTVGDDVGFWFNTVVRADCNSIKIGGNTNIQDGAIIHVTSLLFPTEIGTGVTIGHSAVIHGCKIGNNCLIGMGAILLDGAVIHDHSIVAAGALITPGKVFPERSMIMGSPAKAVRTLSEEEVNMIRQNGIHYLDSKAEYMSQNL